jgi:cytochrome c-type protein NapC
MMEHNQEVKEKKSGLWKRFKSIDWQKPANIWKAVFISLALLAVVGGGSVGALLATSTVNFCGACHEMAPERSTHEASAHANVACVTCHVPPDGPVMYVFHKVKALKEVYYHFTGKPNPIHQHDDEAVPDRTCTQSGCHSLKNLDEKIAAETGININHNDHVGKGIQCIFCHSGVVHGKIAERNLLLTDELKFWDKDNIELAKRIVTDKHRKPNMGTCIECHTRVNAGQKPYEDVNYALPFMEENHEDHTKPVELEVPEEFANVYTDVVQNIIKQAQGLEKDGTKISMKCDTCHSSKSMPSSHDSKTWSQTGHGQVAIDDASKCVKCHTDQNWLRRFPKAEMSDYSKGTDKKTTKSKLEAAEAVKTNAFCTSCHETAVPATHGAGWALGHKAANTVESQKTCLVCHTLEEPIKNEKSKGLTTGAVKCEYCHSL